MVDPAVRKTEIVKGLAAFEAGAASESRSKMIDEHNAAFRWMIASLFALNGGAILSMFGKGALASQSSWGAFWVFFLGILATFSSVISAQRSDRVMIAQLHSWGLHWTTVCLTGVADPERECVIKSKMADAEKLGRSARIMAIFAMAFFVFGVLVAVTLEQKAVVAELEEPVDAPRNEREPI